MASENQSWMYPSTTKPATTQTSPYSSQTAAQDSSSLYSAMRSGSVAVTSVGNFYYGAPTPGAVQTKITLKNGLVQSVDYAVAQSYLMFRSHSKIGTLNDDVLLALARANVSSTTGLTEAQMAGLGARFGIPTEWWLGISKTGGGGGGSGVNRDNEIRSLTAIISDEAARLGIPMTVDEITYIAGVAQKQQWTQAQIIDSITSKLNFDTLQTGTIKASIDKFVAASKDYLVPLSSQTLNQYAARIAKGETTEDAVMTAIREAAKSANPWLATYIDQGLSPSDVLSPNRDYVAQQLEINPLEIDFMKPNDMAMFRVVDANGTVRIANQTELTKTARNDTRWKNTNNAKQLGAEMGSLLARVFGRSVF